MVAFDKSTVHSNGAPYYSHSCLVFLSHFPLFPFFLLQVFESVAALVAELDVLQGFAELAAVAPPPYTRPELTPSDSGDIVLQDCRHPCVELHLGTHAAGEAGPGSSSSGSDPAGSFMANDCILERGKSWCQIITGPNMGGKSTYIRQVRKDEGSAGQAPVLGSTKWGGQLAAMLVSWLMHLLIPMPMVPLCPAM